MARACDQRVSMALAGRPGGLHLTMATAEPGACILVGIGRSVVLDLVRPVRPEDVSLEMR